MKKKLILILFIFLSIFSTNLYSQESLTIQENKYVEVFYPKTLWEREAYHFAGGLILGYCFHYGFIKKREEKKWYHWVIGAASVGTVGYIAYKESVLDIRNNTNSPNIFIKLDNSGNYNWGNNYTVDQHTKSIIDGFTWSSGFLMGVGIPSILQLKSERDSLKNKLEGLEK
jgi:TRAP-type uncharacterized transport system fused permease subunit